MTELVALSTANETPTMENPTDAGAMSRSASSSRKSRIPSTGNRRRSLPRDIGTVLPVVAAFPAGPWPFQVGRLAGLVSPAGYPTLASYAENWQLLYPVS